METIAQRDYIENAKSTQDIVNQLSDIAKSPDSFEGGLTAVEIAEAKSEAEKQLRRADLLSEISSITGRKFAVYDAESNPGAEAFVYTNGDKTIYIAEYILDSVGKSRFDAGHEANHLVTLLALPVKDPDFTSKHLSVLDNYLPVSFKDNVFYTEGFNESLTRKQLGEAHRATAYDVNVKAAEQLESLAVAATGESLATAFVNADYQKFADIMQRTAERLMLAEAIEQSDAAAEERNNLIKSAREYEGSIDRPEKANLIVSSWRSTLKGKKLAEAVKNGDMQQAAEIMKENEIFIATQAPANNNWRSQAIAA